MPPALPGPRGRETPALRDGAHCAATSGTSTVALKVKTKIFQPPAMEEDCNLNARKEEIMGYGRKKTSTGRLTSAGSAAAPCACLPRLRERLRFVRRVDGLAPARRVCHVPVY